MRWSFSASRRDAGKRARTDALQHGGRRGGASLWAFAAGMACVVSLAVAPSALAATGEIEGTVSGSGKPLADVSVSVYGSNQEVEGSASTNASGEYTVPSLAEGEYKVEFSHQPTYVDQFYNKEPSFEDADFVSVSGGKATSGIDATMQEPGKITGVVTNSSGTPVSDVDVEVYGPGSSDFETAKLAFTNANGEYTVTDLAEGEYRVGFFPPEQYISQYYNGQSSLESANPVSVSAGKTTAGVGAVLVEGGKISGVVTDAYSHTGLAKIGVDAYSPPVGGVGGYYGFATTNANGEYTITGLPTGSYKVEFFWERSEAEFKACEHQPRCPLKYITQYFNNQPSEVTANPVTATVGTVTPGVNAAMVPSAPFNTAAPAVSGTPKVGSLLSCSSGSWTGEPELALAVGWPLTAPFTYQWLRDGVPIAGATLPAYLVQTADVGHSLVCEVTATNVAGHTSARSSAIAVNLPSVTLSSSKIAVSGGSARVPIACANATCTGTIELTGQVSVKGKGKKTKKKTVTLAKGSYSLAAGKKATISVRVTAAGKSTLAAAKGHRLSGKAAVTVGGGTTAKKSVVLSEASKGKGK